jgi:hypothetical protein
MDVRRSSKDLFSFVHQLRGVHGGDIVEPGADVIEIYSTTSRHNSKVGMILEQEQFSSLCFFKHRDKGARDHPLDSKAEEESGRVLQGLERGSLLIV